MAKVLVVDDVTADAEVWSAVLQRDGHEVVTASDGAAALRACDRFLPDLVITDLELPPPHGLAIIERLHAVGADVRIIAMSGSDEALHAARRLGVFTALRKPITLREFIAATHSALQAGQMGAA
jgi:CheY-like chemotaxis protein